MSGEREARTEPVPAHIQLIQMGTGLWVSRIVYAAAKLGLADLLAGGPKSAAELADPTRTHGPSLHRLMRALASLGILSEDGNHRFALTTLGEALKTDAAGSARATILTMASDWVWRAWEPFLYCLETGKSGMGKAFGMTAFEFLARHPQEASFCNQAMIGFHGAEPPAVAAAYDFSGFHTLAVAPGIFSPPFSNTILGRVVCSPTCRTWFARLPH
jgi:hypothetical protein